MQTCIERPTRTLFVDLQVSAALDAHEAAGGHVHVRYSSLVTLEAFLVVLEGRELTQSLQILLLFLLLAHRHGHVERLRLYTVSRMYCVCVYV